MADPNDVHNTRQARKHFIKHRIDLSLADLRVSHGVVYLRGTVSAEKDSAIDDLRDATSRVAQIIRRMHGIRDVIVEVQYR